MKFVIALILGLLVGVMLFGAGVVYSPFISKWALSPLAVTESQTITLNYPAVASDAILFTNDGESRTEPYPEKVLQLWEAPIRQTTAMATLLFDARNQPTGFGIKLSSSSEETNLLEGKALANSIWYVYLPGRGGLFVEQSENYWYYIREIVFPAYRSSSDTWKGTWLGNMTAGPGALGMAKVTGGSGDFLDLEMLAVETLSVRAWRVDSGVLAAEGQLLIELPSRQDESLDEEAYELE